MKATIEYAKNNQDRPNTDFTHSAYIERFATPNNDWYHDKFAKDLWSVAPNKWKKKYLKTKEEQQEMIEHWFRANKKLQRPPHNQDTWHVPKDHRLYEYVKQGWRILPMPGTVWRELGNAGQSLAMLLPIIKKGKRPDAWQQFSYHYPEEAKKIESKYPDVLVKKNHEWLRNNLTKVQQKKLEKWNMALKLIKLHPELDTITWWSKLKKKQRLLVGNHAKFLNAEFSLHGEKTKISKFIEPIQNEIKKLRPELVDWYVHKIKHGTSPLRHLHKNESKQKELIKLAEQGEERPQGAMSYVLLGFTKINTKYPDFNKKIRMMRPDWFDRKLLRRKIRQRHFAKKRK
jgi:hypothetical protein